MAGFFQGVDKALTNLSQSPVGMAGMGLLMMPQQSLTPINPFEYAAQGMQMGAQNRQRAQTLSALQERQRQEDEYRQMEYLMQAQEYQDRVLKAKQEEAQQQTMLDAISEVRMGMDPVQRIAFDSQPLSEKAKIIAAQYFPAAQGGRLPAASIQEFNLARKQGYEGTFNDFLSSKRAPPAPNMQFIPTAEGIMVGDTRTGGLTMGQPGALPAAQDPALAGERAQQSAVGTATGQAQAQAQINYPQVEATAKKTINQVRNLLKHPGFRAAVGAINLEKAFSSVPLLGEGTEVTDFNLALEQVKGGQFLEAIKSLRGTGAITEMEGRAATQAISDMSTAQSEEAFTNSANDFINIVQGALDRAKTMAAGGGALPSPQGPGATGQGQQQQTAEEIARQYLQ